jgi:anti-anti-sigma factor
MHLTVHPTIHPPTGIVRASGEIDIATAPHLVDAVVDCLRQQCRIVFVDLTDVSFMDCAGISALVRARAEASDRNAKVHLTAWSAAVERVLVLAGATQLLPPAARAKAESSHTKRRRAAECCC